MRIDATTQPVMPDRTTMAAWRRQTRALAVLAFPWLGQEAVAISPLTLMLAGALLVTAALAFALAWLLQAQARKARQLDEQLQAQQALHRETLDALPFGIILHTPDGRALARNRSGAQSPGIEDAATRVLQDEAFAARADFLRQGGTERRDITYATGDGATHPAQLWIRALLDRQQQLLGYASAALDITPFRNAEEDARQTERNLGDLAQRMPVVVLVMRRHADGEARLEFAAGNTRALFNLEPGELRDDHGLLRTENVRNRVHSDDLASFQSCLSHDAGDMATRHADFRAFGQDGLRWVHATLASTRASDGSLRTMVYFVDTTEQNLRNEALRIARDVAERASKAKADFLANMSHEIRTPMNGVIGMLELLGRTPVNAEQRELLQAVEGSAAALLQILNDILDFSKLEAGDLRLDVAPFDPRRWLDDAATAMSAMARRKGLRLDIAVDAGVAGQLRGDGLRLRQILLNLLGNAIKFTDHGNICARLLLVGDTGSQQHVALVVSDTGIGIAEDRQDALFKPFSQAEAWTSRRYGGTGLGLAICQQLVQLMEGDIALSSKPGAGTTLRVELRLPVEQRPVDAPRALHGRHAVVRLADLVTASALDDYLRAAGMTVERTDPAAPLREGMAASLLFIDEDDHRSAQQISAHVVALGEASRLPAVNTEQRTPLVAHPVRWHALLRACLQALELEAPESDGDTANVAASASPVTDIPRGHILVAEDHPVSQQLIARQLAELGFNCDIVDNGRDAYEALASASYALLLTDGNMPQMSGYELARAWREHEASTGSLHRLPILAMTANAMSGETARAREAGMDDVLSKPLQLAALSAKLDHWLGSPAAPMAPSSAPTADLRRLFASVTAADLPQLQEHAARQDVAAAIDVMHRLLGVLPQFADHALLAEGQQLFEALHEPDGIHALAGLPAFTQRLQRLLTSLDAPEM